MKREGKEKGEESELQCNNILQKERKKSIKLQKQFLALWLVHLTRLRREIVCFFFTKGELIIDHS